MPDALIFPEQVAKGFLGPLAGIDTFTGIYGPGAWQKVASFFLKTSQSPALASQIDEQNSYVLSRIDRRQTQGRG